MFLGIFFGDNLNEMESTFQWSAGLLPSSTKLYLVFCTLCSFMVARATIARGIAVWILPSLSLEIYAVSFLGYFIIPRCILGRLHQLCKKIKPVKHVTFPSRVFQQNCVLFFQVSYKFSPTGTKIFS